MVVVKLNYMMLLSIVITTRNRKQYLLDCLESIKKSDLSGIKYEILIVDDASNDGTEKLKLKDIRIIHNKENLMMVKSRNIGVQKTSGKYILFIDEDNILDSKMIKYLVTFADEHTDYGIIGPSMYYLNSKKKYLDYQTFNFYTGRTMGIVDDSDSFYCDSQGIPNVFLIKREIFNECGYFDENLVQTFTEPDYAFMAKEHGIKCGIVKKAKTFHVISSKDNFSPRALGGMFKQKAYCLMRNRTVMVKRYGTLLQKLVYITFFSWFWPLVYSLLVLKHRRFDLISLYWRGFRDGLIYFFSGKLIFSL